MGFITAPADGAEMSSSTSTAVFWKLGILVAMATAVAAISYYFLVWKPARPKEEKTDEQKFLDWLSGGSQGTPPASNSGSGNTIPAGNTAPSTTSVIGKKAYANKDGVKVLNVIDASTARIKNKNEYVGVIDGEKTISGGKFYSINTGSWVVGKSNVFIK
jgi:hypothetical protein